MVYPTKPRGDVAGTKRELARLVKKDRINTIVIGNGTASRETEEVVSEFIAEQAPDLRYTIVNEAGASVYSASELASQEYPDLDVTVRGAMSLGRRLQDPLAELVKIPPQSIGVGQYQHDLEQAELARTLGYVVEDVVNRVGVDVNTASASLLSYVSGITSTVAKNIVAYREENGAFTDRRELKKVPQAGAESLPERCGLSAHCGRQKPARRHERAPRKLPGGNRGAQAGRRVGERTRARRHSRYREACRQRGRIGRTARLRHSDAHRYYLAATRATTPPKSCSAARRFPSTTLNQAWS